MLSLIKIKSPITSVCFIVKHWLSGYILLCQEIRKRVILVPSKCVLNDLAFVFPRVSKKLFTSIPPQWSPAANVPERKLFRHFQCFRHALCFTREISLTTQRSQNTTYSICVLEKRSCPNFMHTIASRKAITLWVNERERGEKSGYKH